MTAFSATFADVRTIKGRKMTQLIFEVPMEQSKAVIDVLGWPDPANPQWVGIAPLAAVPIGNDQQPELKKGDAEKIYDVDSFPFVATVKYDDKTEVVCGTHQAPKKHWHELSRAQQAGILCSAHDFQKFVGSSNADEAAAAIRARCHVTTRSDLDSSPGAGMIWDAIALGYRQWAGLDPEQRG